jgi:hypothetical protein
MKARTSDDGQIIEDKNEMQSMAAEFYKTLYTSEGVHDMNQVLEHVPRKVTQAMNAILTAEFEPKRRLKRHYSRCSRLKLPDLMATQLFSFKNIGMYVALKLHVAVLSIVRGMESADSINDTILVLISKAKTLPCYLNSGPLVCVTFFIRLLLKF